MRPAVVRLLNITLLGLAGSSAAFASDASIATWHAAQRAEAAHHALSDRYAAIWSTLDAAQKTRFSAQERAWLNEGRRQEQQACLRQAGEPTELAANTCQAQVIERHLAALGGAQRVTASR